MKIAQVTLCGYGNYGQSLQRYALHKTLKKFSSKTEVLWLTGVEFWTETAQFPSWAIPKSSDLMTQQKYYLRTAVRVNKFKEFDNRYIKTRFDIPYIEDVADDYDLFVVGSDQVWNPTWLDPIFLLPFVPSEKKISYAASVASPFIPDYVKEVFKKGVASFSKISVREIGNVKMLEELTGRKIERMIDPVFLLDAEDWEKISQRPSWFDEKYQHGYILTYYLRRDVPPLVESVSKYLNLPVINLSDHDNYWHYTTGPEEFLYLFANADFVFTDSFHGTAFSILFKKIFAAREEYINSNLLMNLRIPNLLEIFGLEGRILNPDEEYAISELLEIDYSVRDKVLPVEKAKAFNFLTDAIQGGGHGI